MFAQIFNVVLLKAMCCLITSCIFKTGGACILGGVCCDVLLVVYDAVLHAFLSAFFEDFLLCSSCVLFVFLLNFFTSPVLLAAQVQDSELLVPCDYSWSLPTSTCSRSLCSAQMHLHKYVVSANTATRIFIF